MKKTTIILLSAGALLLFITIGVIGSSLRKKTSGNVQAAPVTQIEVDTTALAPTPEPKVENWSYAEDKDDMTGKDRFFANCVSTNTVDFKFPYDGGSSLTITVRKMNGKNEVILTVSKGQFIGSYNGEVGMKFDDEPVKTYSFLDAADGSSNYIFLSGSSGIIAKLKKAKRLKIQPPFYQEGQTVFEFNVDGLEWNR